MTSMTRDPRIAEAAIKAALHYDGEKGFANNQRTNVYTCVGRMKRPPAYVHGQGFAREPGCGHKMVTIDREPGVTPFMTACPKCGGDAQSGFYRVPMGLKPTHEWYRPDSLVDEKPHTVEHVLNGGLLLREIVGE